MNFSRNRIEHLPYLKNDTFKNLSLLDLSNNKISTFTTDVFSKSLKVLKLHDNNITSLNNSVLQFLEKPNISLIDFTLYGNPCVVDCVAQKLTEIFSTKTSFNVEKVQCKKKDEQEKLLLKI